MIGIVYSRPDEAGTNMALHLAPKYGFEETDVIPEARYENDVARIYEVQEPSYLTHIPDSFGCDTIVFLSKHKSEAGVESFTTHSLGNWRASADFGGEAKQLSPASPVLMLSVLDKMSKIEENAKKTYEATHHGPLLKTPSLFAELGGNDAMIKNKASAALVADAIYKAIEEFAGNETEFNKVVIGIGSNHYPERFTRLALEKRYAFSHILQKYAIFNEDGSSNIDVLEQALTRSSNAPEAAVVDWKSLNSLMKEHITKKLEQLGLDHEKI